MNKKGVDAQKLDPNMAVVEKKEADLRWHDPKAAPFQVAGLAWLAQEGVYRRLPVTPEWPIRPAVDLLANSTAGAQIRFQTDSARVFVRVKLRGKAGMYHMPATGQCGFDSYIGPVGAQVYCKTTRYDHIKTSDYEAALFEGTKAMRPFTLNFPLYQGVEEVHVGLDVDARVLPPPPYADARRVVFYGTSITQGGCATRPGMAHTNILSRRINLEFINLGFSGNGRGEPELARLVREIPNPGLYVLDYDANATPEGLQETLAPFIALLRERHPQAPILVISRPPNAGELANEKQRQERLAKKAFQEKTVADLRRQGDARIRFQAGDELLGGADWHECFVDGAHPTDLGFMRMADALEPVIRGLLGM